MEQRPTGAPTTELTANFVIDPDLGVLMPDVYRDLQRVARNHLRRNRSGQSLNTTTVVHEAYLKLHNGSATWRNRSHFFALASTAMRQLLVDHARRRGAYKRGGDAVHVTLGHADALSSDALTGLAAFDPVLERVVECRFFAGLSVEDTALALDRPKRTVERDWARARAYLFQALSGDR
jgi:RNA polymerase sigma factor (TIGR02999 family)